MGIIAALFPPIRKPVEIESADPITADLDIEQYEALAKKAGFVRARHAIKENFKRSEVLRFRRFLAENGICVYDPWRVEKYMDSITPRKHIWRWLDTDRESGADEDPRINPAVVGFIDLRPLYSKPIPEAVLLTMARIRAEFTGAWFQVTDITEQPKGDPFLRVILHDAWYIIERWDEPGFRM